MHNVRIGIMIVGVAMIVCFFALVGFSMWKEAHRRKDARDVIRTLGELVNQ